MAEDMKKNQERAQEHENVNAGKDNTPADEHAENGEKGGRKKAGKKDRPEKKTEELEQRFEELNDKFLRLYSEYDNYRKRTVREKIELSKTASGEVIVDLLPVLDDFERALKAFEDQKATESESLKEGVLLIFNKLKNMLERKGLEEIKAMGEPFDTEYHDAVTNIPAPSGDLKGKVVDVIEKGYLLNGKVIRYAKVVVGN